MSKRTAFGFAWFTWALYLVIAIITLLFQMKNAPSGLLSDIFNALVLLAFATVGALIASRRPQNPIGWIFCISTLLWALGNVLQEYTTYALITVPGAHLLAAALPQWTSPISPLALPGLAHRGPAGRLLDYLPALALSLRQFCNRSSSGSRAQ